MQQSAWELLSPEAVAMKMPPSRRLSICLAIRQEISTPVLAHEAAKPAQGRSPCWAGDILFLWRCCAACKAAPSQRRLRSQELMPPLWPLSRP